MLSNAIRRHWTGERESERLNHSCSLRESREARDDQRQIRVAFFSAFCREASCAKPGVSRDSGKSVFEATHKNTSFSLVDCRIWEGAKGHTHSHTHILSLAGDEPNQGVESGIKRVDWSIKHWIDSNWVKAWAFVSNLIVENKEE